jgi:hypothetical protein
MSAAGVPTAAADPAPLAPTVQLSISPPLVQPGETATARLLVVDNQGYPLTRVAPVISVTVPPGAGVTVGPTVEESPGVYTVTLWSDTPGTYAVTPVVDATTYPDAAATLTVEAGNWMTSITEVIARLIAQIVASIAHALSLSFALL